MKRKNLKVAVIGHSGMGGSALVDQLLQRGHTVTGLSIDADKVPEQKGLTNITMDVLKSDQLAEALLGHDVVVSTFSGGHAVDMSVYCCRISYSVDPLVFHRLCMVFMLCLVSLLCFKRNQY